MPHPEKTLAEINNPDGIYSTLDQGGDVLVAHIDKHGIHTNTAWPNAHKSTIAFFSGPSGPDEWSRSSPSVPYGQMLLNVMNTMQAGEEKVLIFVEN